MDMIDALAIAVPPPDPSARIALPDAAWDRFEARNGFRAPAEYRAVLDRWGFGTWGWTRPTTGFWDLLTLTDPFQPGGLAEQGRGLAEMQIGLRRRVPDGTVDWPIWPEPGGWMCIGTDSNGGSFGWFREGDDPDAWAVGHLGSWVGDSFRFEVGIAEYLYRLMVGALGVDLDEYARNADEDGSEPAFLPGVPAVTAPPGAVTTVTVTTDGIGSPGDAPGPARSVVEGWLDRLPAPLRWVGHGSSSDAHTAPRWEVTFSFPPEDEPAARAAVQDLGRLLGVGIADCRNQLHEPIWPDIRA